MPRTDAPARDLRGLAWCSIDNDDSKDLDQISMAERLPNGRVRLRVAIADVDAVADRLVAQGTYPIGDTPAEFAATIESDIRRYAELIRTAGIRAE